MPGHRNHMQPSVPTSSPDPLLETQVFWEKYKLPLLLGVLAVILATAAVGGYRMFTARRDASAAAALAAAKEPADFEKVIADYPNSAAAPSARLFLAKAQREKKQFAEANATLQAFISKEPKHELISTAKMAMAANLESLGKADEALEQYRRTAADHPRSYNAPLALVAEVPLLKAKGQLEEARRVAETVMTQYRESYASGEAASYLRTIKPAAAPVAAGPAPAAAADGSPSTGEAPAMAVSPASSPAATP